MDNLVGELTMCFLGAIDEERAIALLRANPALHSEKYLGDPWIVVAATKGAELVCRELIALGADVNAEGDGAYALERAMESDNLEIASMLLKNGADPNLGRGLLIAVGKDPDVSYTRLLISHGVEINRKFDIFGEQFKTAVDWASEKPEVLALLRAAGGLSLVEMEGA